MDEQQLKQIVEGALLAAGRALTIDDLSGLFDENEQVGRDEVRAALQALDEDCAARGFELKEVSRLWAERPSRYSRALLETLALIAYRQPITRGEIEDIRGVSVSSSIMKTLQEREWIRVVGHRDVPGKPAMYATTKTFLDYFDLKSLEELPPLSELRDIDSINAELDLEGTGVTLGVEEQGAGTEEVAQMNNEGSAEGLDEAAAMEQGEAEPAAEQSSQEALSETPAEEQEPADRLAAEDDSAVIEDEATHADQLVQAAEVDADQEPMPSEQDQETDNEALAAEDRSGEGVAAVDSADEDEPARATDATQAGLPEEEVATAQTEGDDGEDDDYDSENRSLGHNG
jgi:segregation and condensation protein B